MLCRLPPPRSNERRALNRCDGRAAVNAADGGGAEHSAASAGGDGLWQECSAHPRIIHLPNARRPGVCVKDRADKQTSGVHPAFTTQASCGRRAGVASRLLHRVVGAVDSLHLAHLHEALEDDTVDVIVLRHVERVARRFGHVACIRASASTIRSARHDAAGQQQAGSRPAAGQQVGRRGARGEAIWWAFGTRRVSVGRWRGVYATDRRPRRASRRDYAQSHTFRSPPPPFTRRDTSVTLSEPPLGQRAVGPQRGCENGAALDLGCVPWYMT
jgi:hypothetical protein